MPDKNIKRTCDKHPGRALYRIVKGTALCADCFHGQPVTAKPRSFELVAEAEFPGEPEHGLLWRALDALKHAAPGMAVKVPANGRACHRMAKALHQIAKRQGFEIQTRSRRGMWIYVRRRAATRRAGRAAAAAQKPIPIRREKSA